MRYYAFIPLLLALALAQSTLMPHFTALGVKPDLMLLFVLGWGMIRGFREAILWGALGGGLLDLFSGAPFGINLLVLASVAFLTALSETKVLENSLLLGALVTLMGTLIYYSLFLLLLQILGNRVLWGASLIHIFLPAALVNMLLMPLAWWFLGWFSRHTQPVTEF